MKNGEAWSESFTLLQYGWHTYTVPGKHRIALSINRYVRCALIQSIEFEVIEPKEKHILNQVFVANGTGVIADQIASFEQILINDQMWLFYHVAQNGKEWSKDEIVCAIGKDR